MNTWRFLTLSVLALLTWSPSPSFAQDALTARGNEIKLGPFDHEEHYQGVRVRLQGWVFLVTEMREDDLRIRARIVGDFSNLQEQIQRLAKKLSLPSEDCTDDNVGSLRYRLKTRDEKLTPQVDRAYLSLRGKVDACFQPENPLGWPPLPIIKDNFSLKASSHFRLTASGQHKLVLESENPNVEIEGNFGALAQSLLREVGVDLNRELQRLLVQVLDPVDLKSFLPEGLIQLGPKLTAARFFDHGGRLAAEINLEVVLDGEALQQGEILSLRLLG